LLLAACRSVSSLDGGGRALRAELQRLLPELSESERIVPFEIDSATAEFGKKIVEGSRTAESRALAIVHALSDAGEGLALRYQWALHNSARETLAAGSGTCMGLSSVLVGMARSVGLRARYVDARDISELREELGMRVIARHVAVVIATDRGPLYVDFSGRLLPESGYDALDDLEAAAHYYNNRGYELIHLAEHDHTPVPWEEVRVEFERAIRIAPDFASAWNNLGVALGRLGRAAEAEASYRRALALDPRFASAERNLEALQKHELEKITLEHGESASESHPGRPVSVQSSASGAR
jgi:tetratricopeptide (TPR) repeat protein